MSRALSLAALPLALAPLLATFAQPARAAQECLARTIAQTGQCAGFKGSGVQATLDRELRGVLPQNSPPPFDLSLAATRITGVMATGKAWPLGEHPTAKANTRKPAASGGELWLILAHASEPNANGELRQRDNPARSLSLVRWQAAAAGPAQSANEGSRPNLQVLAQWQALQAYLSLNNDDPELYCMSPSGNHAGAPQYLGPPFGWVQVGSRWLLGVTATRSEGYAGGGATFTSRVLLEQRGEDLHPVACYGIEDYQMFGGDWNPDGTRQHPEQLSRWRMQVGPPKPPVQAKDVPTQYDPSWPDLLLKPLTPKTPAARLIWDGARDYYLPPPKPAAARAPEPRR